MKIGVILDHISLRSDIRIFIEELGKDHQLCLFGYKSELESLDGEFESRIFYSHSNLWNNFLKLIYYFFGNLPSTKSEYKEYIERRLFKSESQKNIKKGLLKLKIRMLCPQLISFDTYIKLRKTKNNKIDDIDVFISFTDINNEDIISDIIKQKKKLYTYVHSWDHIPKFHRFSRKHIHYITWNNNLKRDLIKIHQVSERNVSTLAASQFYFIKEYFINKKKNEDAIAEEYVYFPCSFGYPKVVKQELKIIEKLAEELSKIDSDIKLMVRSYPMLKDWGIYDDLKSIENIVFDDYERSKKIILNKNQHMNKCHLIENAVAVFHVGTTIGLEASYFDTPVIYLNIEDIDYGLSKNDPSHIFNSWNQYHLKTYFKFNTFKSVVCSLKELKEVLTLIIQKDAQLLDYNDHLRSNSKLLTINEFKEEFLNIIDKGHDAN